MSGIDGTVPQKNVVSMYIYIMNYIDVEQNAMAFFFNPSFVKVGKAPPFFDEPRTFKDSLFTKCILQLRILDFPIVTYNIMTQILT